MAICLQVRVAEWADQKKSPLQAELPPGPSLSLQPPEYINQNGTYIGSEARHGGTKQIKVISAAMLDCEPS